MYDSEEIVYFELNNWSCGLDYPDSEPFISWMCNDFNQQFQCMKWVKENRLCIIETFLDLSHNYLITATKQWVQESCPLLLTEYTQFLRYPDKYGCIFGKNVDIEFLEYCEDNIGFHHVDEYSD